jgi:SSS family solute:Na+ symporter
MSDRLMFAAGATPLIKIGPLDIVIIGIYFLVVLGIGIYLKRYVSTGEDFFMAGRKMTAWIAGLSFISANLSSLETMGWSAMAYQYGMLGAHAYLIGAIPSILFLAIFMMPFYYICKTHSVPGYLKLRYDERCSGLSGTTFAVMMVLVSGASMFAMAKILNLLLGWNMNASIWVASLTVAVYVTLGGLISAVFNEVLQYFLIWFGSLLIPILGLIDAGGWQGMMDKIQQHTPLIHPALPENADFQHLWRNLGSFDTNPMGIDWFGMVFGLGLAVSSAYWCTDFLQVQRVIVAKDLRSAQNGTIIGAVLKMCVPLIVTIPGLLGLAVLLNTDGSPTVLVPESDPRANITLQTYNDVLPLLMGKYLGPGLLGLGVTAMIAGFMSGMAGNVSAFATVWTYDVYRPHLYKKGSDAHYLAMGRWSSLFGVLASIGTAYLLFLFSNILEFLQVLLYFFIVPVFGLVVVGMFWKRATPTAGFCAFLAGMTVSIAMWISLHTFPDGFRPHPQAVLEPGAVVRLEKAKGGSGRDEITRVIVESGTVKTTNVPVPIAGGSPLTSGTGSISGGDATLPTSLDTRTGPQAVRLLAPDIKRAETGESDKFGLEGVPVILQPGVNVEATDITRHFAPAENNPDHAKWIARSEKAKPMAVNMYSGFWTLVATVATLVGVSLVTRPKPDAELKDVVMGLTPIPKDGPARWYTNPKLWAAVVFAALIAINVIFW